MILYEYTDYPLWATYQSTSATQKGTVWLLSTTGTDRAIGSMFQVWQGLAKTQALNPLLDSNKNNCSDDWWGPHLISQVAEDWAMTKSYRDDQRILIQRADDLGNFKWFKPLHRHHKKYRVKQSIRINKIRKFSMPVRYFATLTVDPKRFSNDLQAYDDLLNSWRKIYHRLRRKFPRLQVLRCVEPQKQGQPHMHLMLFGCNIPKLKSWASEMYRISSGYIRIEPARAGNKGAASYLGKYLTKGLKNDFTLAFLTRWRCQTLTVSGKQLREFLGPLIDYDPSGEWVFYCFLSSYGDACIELSEEFAELIYYPLENGPPIPENPFIRP